MKFSLSVFKEFSLFTFKELSLSILTGLLLTNWTSLIFSSLLFLLKGGAGSSCNKFALLIISALNKKNHNCFDCESLLCVNTSSSPNICLLRLIAKLMDDTQNLMMREQFKRILKFQEHLLLRIHPRVVFELIRTGRPPHNWQTSLVVLGSFFRPPPTLAPSSQDRRRL